MKKHILIYKTEYNEGYTKLFPIPFIKTRSLKVKPSPATDTGIGLNKQKLIIERSQKTNKTVYWQFKNYTE